MNYEASKIPKIHPGAGQGFAYRPFGRVERMRVAYENDAETRLAEMQKYPDVDHPITKWTQSGLERE
jgi:hypothetical protein